MTDFFDRFGPHAAMIATAAGIMREMGLTPDDVLRLYDERLEALKAGMIPATPEYRERAAKAAAKAERNIRRHPGQADDEHRLGACPKCGAEVWGIKKCPHIAPPWRVFFACDNDECSYHGRSRLDVAALRRRWPEGAESEPPPQGGAARSAGGGE